MHELNKYYCKWIIAALEDIMGRLIVYSDHYEAIIQRQNSSSEVMLYIAFSWYMHTHILTSL